VTRRILKDNRIPFDERMPEGPAGNAIVEVARI